MRARSLGTLAILAATATVGGWLAARPAPAAPIPTAAQAWKVDSGHSSVIFAVQHLKTAWFYGAFGKVSGSLNYDAESASGGSLRITVDADSVQTRSGKRDQHVKSPDFFNAKQFPEISFQSDSVVKTGDDRYAVKGNLTFLGVTKPTAFSVTMTGAGQSPDGSARMGWLAELSIHRSEFGSNFMQGPLGDEIKLVVSLSVVPE